ncbi:MAG TPA: DapH/DapD/GlmU-related protein [Chthoniobacterales bacterium]
MTQHITTFEQPGRYGSPWSVRERVLMLLWAICWPLFCAWTPKPLNRWRLFWLQRFGATVHGEPFIHQRARIQIPWNLTLHHRACLGDRASAYSLGPIVLETGCTVAQEAYLCTGTHAFEEETLPLQTAPIRICENAFVGARAFLLPGVTIGRNAVVGACSVVTRDVPAEICVAGNPARPLAKREFSRKG